MRRPILLRQRFDGRAAGALQVWCIDPSRAGMSDTIQTILETRRFIRRVTFLSKESTTQSGSIAEERLGLIHNLKRGYGDSIEQILEFAIGR
jgi:hypothetical protein